MRSLNRTELIVIALLFVVFLALGLPWVLSSRQDARLHQCRNNLRRIGQGMNNNVKISNGRFPAGTFGSRQLAVDKRLAWTVPVALRQRPRGDKSSFDPSVAWDAEPNLTPEIAGRPMVRNPLFHCPDDTTDSPPEKLQFSSYVGMAGIGKEAATLLAGDPSAGIFGYDRRTTMTQLGNNREYRICVLDTSRNNAAWTSGGLPTLRSFLPDESPFIGDGLQFGGHHTEGSVVLMADFRVRVFSTETDAGLFAKLCPIAGK